MSREYPCVYYDNEKCRKDSPEEGYVDWCVMGPCSYETPSNGDRIRAMSDEELAAWICGVAYGRETLWSEPFEKKFCDNCPTVHGTFESGKEGDFHECDFVDGECPHGSDILWWLKQPVEEVSDG